MWQREANAGEPCNPGAGAEVRFATSAGEARMRLIPPRHSAWREDLMCPPLGKDIWTIDTILGSIVKTIVKAYVIT